MKNRAHILGGLAGVVGILVAGGVGYATVGNHHATFTTGSANTASTTNQTTANDVAVHVPQKPQVVFGNSTSTIELVKQETHFQAKVPSYLPEGYGDYTAKLQNFPKGYANRQVLSLYYRGPNKNQFLYVQEFPYPNHKLPFVFQPMPKKLPTGFNSKTAKPTTIKPYTTIDGIDVWGSGAKLTFVSHGLNFTVNSFGNSSDNTVKFVKSLIEGGKPFN